MYQWDTQDSPSRWPSASSALWRRTLVGPVPLKCPAGAVQLRATAYISSGQVSDFWSPYNYRTSHKYLLQN